MMLSATFRRILDQVAHAQRSGKPVNRYGFTPRERERVDTLLKGGLLEAAGDDGHLLALTRKGDDARRPPLKALRSDKWRPEPRGPCKAEHKFADVEGERLELLAYTFLITRHSWRNHKQRTQHSTGAVQASLGAEARVPIPRTLRSAERLSSDGMATATPR